MRDDPFSFDLPAPGKGKLAHFRRSGKIVGDAYAKRMVEALALAEQKGVLTVEVREHLMHTMIGDMVGTTNKLRALGYREKPIARFEQGMLVGFKTVSISNHASAHLH